MARVVLHIGAHKTGSTAVQEALAANRALLARHGFLYPRLTRRTAAHHGLAALWNPALKRYEPRGGAEAAWRALARKHRDGEGVLVLSSEELSRALGPTAVDYHAVRELLSGFERVDVICLLRDQVSFLQSAYLQIAKVKITWPDRRGRPLVPWSTFLEHALQTGQATSLALDHNALLDRLDAAFGRERVHLVPYAEAAARPTGVIGLVLAEMGCPVDPAALAAPGGGRVNVTDDPLSVWAASQISAPLRPSAALIATVREVVSHRFGPRTTLYNGPEIAAVRRRFAPGNERLARRMEGRRPGFALPWMSEEGVARRGGLSRDFWIEVARRLHAARRGL